MSNDGSGVWEFETDRLRVGPWHEVAERLGVDLAVVVAALLTVRTTGALPESWQGEYSVEREGLDQRSRRRLNSAARRRVWVKAAGRTPRSG